MLYYKVMAMITIKSISMVMITLISVLGDTLIKMMLPYNEKPLFVSPMNKCRFHLLLIYKQKMYLNGKKQMNIKHTERYMQKGNDVMNEVCS